MFDEFNLMVIKDIGIFGFKVFYILYGIVIIKEGKEFIYVCELVMGSFKCWC